MNVLIETPTYWKREGSISVFDHPIPLNSKGWLKRYLRNVTNHSQFDSVKKLVLFPAPLTFEIESRVKNVSKGFDKIETFSLETLNMLKNMLKKHNFSKEFIRTINADTYPCVRNLGLIKGALENADLLILLDDDEIILDGNFMKKALETDGLHGKTGAYTAEGKFYLHVPEPPKWALKWQKTELIAETIKKYIDSGKRFTETSIALGGCMVITKELYQNVCFDPYIARGEDLDFLINAKHQNYKFLFDTRLAVEHLPPQGANYFWPKFKGDIHRFIYERQKIKDLRMDSESFKPYPGDFLEEDLEERIIYTARNFEKDVLKKRESKLIKLTKMEIKKAKDYASKHSKRYVSYLSEWKKMMALLPKI